MTVSRNNNRWILRTMPNPDARIRLFCVPYAGRGASVYREWPQLVSSQVDVCVLQLPGRESRLREEPLTRMEDVVEQAMGAMDPLLDIPVAFFGHSMGGLICFELARQLAIRHDVTPVHLFISARRAPHLRDPRPLLHVLSDKQFVAEIRRRYNGIPEAVLRDQELMDLLLPVVRADVEMLETYSYIASEPLGCPITALGGRNDSEARFEEVAAWRQHTSAQFRTVMFSGDHFFLQSAQTELLELVSQQLEAELVLSAAGSR